MANIQKILDFYGYETAEGRCRCYQEVQRAREEMANILINGGKKYNKDRRKNYKNHRRKKKEKKKKGEESSERPEKQWRPQRNIYDREKIPVVAFGSEMFRKDSVNSVDTTQGDVLVVTVDEFRTSRVCNSCDKMAFTSAFINPHGIQSCTECGLLWQRDINASKNIFKIANGILRGCGRPQAFLRRIEHCSPSGL
ncbi:hypothetical protein G6F70_000738 [Rhizopus microsporus]|nr:hypothetical protein G6F71_007641 [Rhizopus microsporus]KAG1204167.1 hypothetical protein G6F70_000738 [Rhizopus microsporus]KAG1211084.1 hypothetical protein G6F69_004899 [Rhizopus microsporus]KAG1232944.1 hypothetical protein G6F67_004637 [Rhizopus microsporus]KAG1265018.1 hypothetical protein G6F68_003925 [Rhizopus microsporus]